MTLVVWDLGWVDSDLSSSLGWLAVTSATYCPDRIVEYPKSKSTQPRSQTTRVTLYMYIESYLLFGGSHHTSHLPWLMSLIYSFESESWKRTILPRLSDSRGFGKITFVHQSPRRPRVTRTDSSSVLPRLLCRSQVPGSGPAHTLTHRKFLCHLIIIVIHYHLTFVQHIQTIQRHLSSSFSHLYSLVLVILRRQLHLRLRCPNVMLQHWRNNLLISTKPTLT